LNLGSNDLEGKIPKCLGSLGNLIELNLGGNKLVGVLPSSLGNLSNLQTLDFRFSYFLTAKDLEWISHLSNLRYLDLSFVNLTLAVDWLSSISRIPSLFELHLYKCGLHQVTPKSIPHLNTSITLKSLSLSYNEIQSSILKYFRNMSQLQELQLNTNKLSGKLSDNIQQLCSTNNGLKKLDLSNNPFIGGPLPDFACFSLLESISLQNTNIVGSFPKSLVHMPSFASLPLSQNHLNVVDIIDDTSLPNIQYLDLSFNQLNGSLTLFEIAKLALLESLDLSHNQLSGVDIIDDASLPTIHFLDLSFNQLNGSLPLLEITKLASLETIDLSHNHLSGPLPHTIGQFSSLKKLLLSSNKLNGVVNETHLSKLSQLEILDVNHNSLSFNLSSDWVQPFKLERLYASSCTLGPKFPVWLKQQGKLVNLEISNSGISDSFPKWFWNLSSSLEYLNVSHNNLYGPLPKSFPRMQVKAFDHVVWDFSFNNLNGSLPPFPKLVSLFLSNNMFTGSLSSFCTSSSPNLIYLDLSSNFLVGKLSDCWGKFQKLKVLNLEKNNLSGRVPNSFGTLKQIESLQLNNNNFFGEIPSLILCRNLKLIDVGDNNLQGMVPMWIGHHLHQLIVLRLQANKLQGNIPTSMCHLSFLQVLDLSKNNITGEIPQCFSHIVALSNLTFPRKVFHYISLRIFDTNNDVFEIGSFNHKVVLGLKGLDREYGKNLGLMTTIDLSCNHLTGEIPRSITKLVALVGLNLSGNHLTGLIPNNIGHMKMLESLDLSRNHLYGKMPTSFSSLTFLGYMNLSFNNLEGKIPLGTQLQSFDPSSYVGNNRLCGPPLINLCPGVVISPTSNHDKHVITSEEEDKLITFGFYVSLVIGFFVGFWGVCGTLVIKTSWRHAYFKFFNKLNDWIHVTLSVFMNRLKKIFQVED